MIFWSWTLKLFLFLAWAVFHLCSPHRLYYYLHRKICLFLFLAFFTSVAYTEFITVFYRKIHFNESWDVGQKFNK